MRNSSKAIAARLADYFDRAIESNHVRPNLVGEYSFGMLKTSLYILLEMNRITEGIRRNLLKCGYKLRISGNEVEVTKYR